MKENKILEKLFLGHLSELWLEIRSEVSHKFQVSLSNSSYWELILRNSVKFKA